MSKNPAEIVRKARESFDSGITKSHDFRLTQLKGFRKFFAENEHQILQLLTEENRKPKFESYIGDINFMKNDIENAIQNLKDWMDPEEPPKPLPFIMDKARIYREPYGVVLIIGPWNYPFTLALSPLVGALAAGNCVVLKPSEIVPKTAKFLEDELPKYLDKNCCFVYNGGVPETSALLEQRFDYIFYTGSTSVGKIVYSAAAKYLTPVTLELGGKSPVYVDDSADIDLAARRIMWGKCFNAGQSCLEPDYVLCSEYVRDKFIAAAKNVVQQFYGSDVSKSPDYCRIITQNHFNRICKLIEGSDIAFGGTTDANDRLIEPTVLINVKPNDQIMEEEIFGPVLPILTVATPEEAIEFIRKREKPLAIYIFSTSKMEQDKFIRGTSSGGICINDVMMHYTCDTLPFGGVGSSGMGSYHGVYSFLTFSHRKAALIKTLDKLSECTQSIRYPPYSDKKLQLITMASKKFPKVPGAKFLRPLLYIFCALFIYFYILYKK